jgi:hypothetical protein
MLLSTFELPGILATTNLKSIIALSSFPAMLNAMPRF